MANTIRESLVIEEVPATGYEKIYKITDERIGLKAIICIHSTILGPALGGTRMYPYPNFEAALYDVMRLAQGMTRKSSMLPEGFGLGGGKSIIISDPTASNKKALLRRFGEAVDLLEGRYICAQDVGLSVEDVDEIAKSTAYVVGTSSKQGAGNPSPYTAWGTFRAIQATLFKTYGDCSLKGRTVAIQGLGSVGMSLAEQLHFAGAKLIVTDVDWEKVKYAVTRFQARAAGAEDIYCSPCDIFAPCAMGAVLTPQTIAKLNCKGVAGAANNQLLKEGDAQRLKNRGILYAPDYVANGGGLINVICETAPDGYKEERVKALTNSIYDELLRIFELAEQRDCTPSEAANSLSEYRLKYVNSASKKRKLYFPSKGVMVEL